MDTPITDAAKEILAEAEMWFEFPKNFESWAIDMAQRGWRCHPQLSTYRSPNDTTKKVSRIQESLGTS